MSLHALKLTYTHLILVSELPLIQTLKEKCIFYKPHSISHPFTKHMYTMIYYVMMGPIGTDKVCVWLHWLLKYWNTAMTPRKQFLTEPPHPSLDKFYPDSLVTLTLLPGSLE